MKLSFRWYGEDDPVSLSEIRQIPGVKTIVSACYDVPPGQPWKRERVAEIRGKAEKNGLSFEVAEGLPVHEDIKLGDRERDTYIQYYIENLRLLAGLGIKVVCYNFMPVFGWLRTDLDFRLPDGSHTLAFDLKKLEGMNPQEEELRLPGWSHSSRKEERKELILRYQELGEQGLRENLRYFLEAVVPKAEEFGIQMAIHPDDPPISVFGLPRVVSTEEDLEKITAMAESPANGITLCTGSLGSIASNDVVRIAGRFAAKGKIPFVHARNVLRGEDGKFAETGHQTQEGSLNMADILYALKKSGFDGYIRPDHGRMIWEETGRPGYGLFDRALGAAYLNGLWEALGKEMHA